MSKKFEFKLEKKSVKLNLKIFDIKKITLKLIGIYGGKQINFNAKVNIKLNSDIDNLINKVEIVEIDVYNSLNDDCSFCSNNIYNLSSDSSTSSSSSMSDRDEKIYKQVNKFIKNIKFITNNGKLTNIVFSLKKTNIKKLKVSGKLSQ